MGYPIPFPELNMWMVNLSALEFDSPGAKRSRTRAVDKRHKSKYYGGSCEQRGEAR